MNTFKLEVYAYPIGSDDWRKRQSFYFDAEKFEMEKHDRYFTVKVTASDFPLEHYKREDGAHGCRRAEQSIHLYAKVDGNNYTFPCVQCVNFKGVWD